MFKILVNTVASKVMPVNCGRRLCATPTHLNALPQLRAVIQWAMHAQPNKTVDIRDIRDSSLALAGFVVSYASSDFRMKAFGRKEVHDAL